MNLTKFNFYKNAKYFLIGFGLIMLAGLIVGLILGLNLVESLGGSVVMYFSIAFLIVMVIAFVYLSLRYDVLTAFCFVLSLFINTATVVALVAIIRVPVGDNFVSVLVLTSVLTFVENLILFSKIKTKKHEKYNRDIIVNNCIKDSLFNLLFVSILLVVCLTVCLALLDSNIYLFVRPMLISVVVCLISSIFINGAVWGYFYKDRPKKVKVKDETIYVEEEK